MFCPKYGKKIKYGSKFCEYCDAEISQGSENGKTEKANTIFIHCLPAHHTNGIHDMEVLEEVFESKASKIFDEADNKLHTIKALMIASIVG